MIDFLKLVGDMIEDSRKQAIRLYAEQHELSEDEIEAFHPHEVEFGGDKMAITWLCYRKGSFVRQEDHDLKWPEHVFMTPPWEMDRFQYLDGGILDLGLPT